MRARRVDLERFNKDTTTHAGLWLDKFLSEQNQQGGGDEGVGEKAAHFRSLGHHPCPVGYREAFERWKSGLDGQPNVTLGRAAAQGRLIIGLGEKGVLEAGVSLDHTWGTPLLPGSALKGVAASAARRLVEGWEKPKEDAEKAEKAVSPYRFLFGDTDERGAVIFHDAWWIPENEMPLHQDVITVHHAPYYQGKQDAPPSDTDSPNPVAFMSVSGAYLVALEASPGLEDAAGWLSVAFRLLELGLAELGVGAKTNAGYGRMALRREGANAPTQGKSKSKSMATTVIPFDQLDKGKINDVITPELLQVAPELELERFKALVLSSEYGPKWLRKRLEKKKPPAWIAFLFPDGLPPS